MSPLEQLYGSSQTYQNPGWNNTGQAYAQPMQTTGGIEGMYQKPQAQQSMNPMVQHMAGSNGGTQMTGGVGDLGNAYMGGTPGFYDNPPMASQPGGSPLPPQRGGIDPSRLWSNQEYLNPNQAPIFGVNDFSWRDDPGQMSESGNQIGGYTGWQIAPGANRGGQGENWILGGTQDAPTLSIKSDGKYQGQSYNYSKDPTGQYWIPQEQGQQRNMGRTAFGANFWAPLALATPMIGGVVGAGMGMGAEAAGGAGAGLEGATGAAMGGGEAFAGMAPGTYGGEALVGGSGGALSGGGLTEAGLDTLAPAAQGAPEYMGTGSSAASGGGPIGSQAGYGADTTSLLGNAGETTNMSLQDLQRYYQAAQAGSQILPGENGGGQQTRTQGTPQTIADMLAAWYSQNRMNNYGGDLMGMYSRMEQNAQPYLQRLNESYSNPDSYYNSPQYQSMQRLEENRLNRRAGQTGRLANDIDRETLLQDFAAKNIENYRSGLRTSVGDLYGNAARYAGMYQAGSTAHNASGAPFFAGMGQGSTGSGGGIPWDQLWEGGSNLWDQYGDDITNWLGSAFGG